MPPRLFEGGFSTVVWESQISWLAVMDRVFSGLFLPGHVLILLHLDRPEPVDHVLLGGALRDGKAFLSTLRSKSSRASRSSS